MTYYKSRSDSTYLLGRDGLLAGLAKLLDGLLVVTEILLAADEDDGQTLAEVQDLRDPLFGLHMSACLSGGASGGRTSKSHVAP